MADTTITYDDFVDGRSAEGSPASTDNIPTKKSGVTAKKTQAGSLVISAPSPISITKTSNYTIQDADTQRVFYLSGASGNVTFILPTAADNTDREYTFMNLDATYILTIDGEGAETINGNATIALTSQYNMLKVKCTGTAWIILDSNITYDSGWVSLADWTDATVTITHNMNVQRPYLLARGLWSTSGADGADNYRITEEVLLDETGANSFGANIVGSGVNAVIFQTGDNGAMHLTSAGAVSGITSGYYRIMLKRMF